MALGASDHSRICLALVATIGLAACSPVFNKPINQLALVEADVPETLPPAADGESATVVGLALSGGGTRAAAFSYGMLRELERTPIPDDPDHRTMIDAVRFISGVSGGSVTAAYYGLKGKAGYHDFREKFLIRDAEAYMRTSVGPINLLRAYRGGVNNEKTFGRWLDRNLFDGARFADLRRSGGPKIWINASDIYNNTPFIFEHQTFAALCSNLDELPIAGAVAASAAVPIVFSPIVLKSYGRRCSYRAPDWLVEALDDPSSSLALSNFARALESYRQDEQLQYVKLVDGGITDNYGVTALALARAASQTPYGPLTPKEAVRLKRLIYLVADAEQVYVSNWGKKERGPGVVNLVEAVTFTAMESAVHDGYDSFRFEMERWRSDLIEYRCGLSPSEVRRLRGTASGWNCRDVEFFVANIDFDDVGPKLHAELEVIPTRLKLPEQQVDQAISGGSLALRNNPIFKEAIASIDGANGSSRNPALTSQLGGAAGSR